MKHQLLANQLRNIIQALLEVGYSDSFDDKVSIDITLNNYTENGSIYWNGSVAVDIETDNGYLREGHAYL